MELVIVNGASNISKRLIQSLVKQGQYNRVRLLDFKPYHQQVYAFQRELNQQGVIVDKRLTTNGQALDIALEGADKVVYVTHDYTSLVACKNNFLVGTAKLAKKHGVKNLVAVCPVEHDLAYTETEGKSWVEVRHEAELNSLNENKQLTILNTDLVYSDKPTHLIHYIAQRVAKGSIAAPFLSDATFKPISSEDLATAVSHKLLNGGHGHFALRGDKELTIKQIVGIVEKASHKSEGSTQASKFNPLILAEEFFTGLTVDQNMTNMVQHFASTKEQPVTGTDFWQAKQLKASQDIESFYRQNSVSHASLAEPSFGDYKLPWLNF